MASFEDIQNKLNELRSIIGEIEQVWPTDQLDQKEKVNVLMRFATDRLQSEYVQLLHVNEINNIFNAINAIIADLTNYKNTKHPNYIRNAVAQINNLRVQLNAIPTSSINQISLRKLIAECSKMKDVNAKTIDQLRQQQDDLKSRGDRILNQAINLLSNVTTGVLSKEFELKRQTEIGGLPQNFKPLKWLGVKKLGVYQKNTIGLWLLLLIMCCIVIFGGYLIDYIVVLDKPQTSLWIYALIKFIVRLSILGPLIWLAIVQNKKMNLSKKLAEEYWHKEIITKTFVGLSDQIDKTTEGETSKKLRLKLLELTLDTIRKILQTV